MITIAQFLEMAEHDPHAALRELEASIRAAMTSAARKELLCWKGTLLLSRMADAEAAVLVLAEAYAISSGTENLAVNVTVAYGEALAASGRQEAAGSILIASERKFRMPMNRLLICEKLLKVNPRSFVDLSAREISELAKHFGVTAQGLGGSKADSITRLVSSVRNDADEYHKAWMAAAKSGTHSHIIPMLRAAREAMSLPYYQGRIDAEIARVRRELRRFADFEMMVRMTNDPDQRAALLVSAPRRFRSEIFRGRLHALLIKRV